MNPAGWFLPTISSKPCPSPSPPLCSRCHSFLLKSLSSHSRVSCSCGVGQGQATTALRGPSLFGGSLDHPDQRGRHSHHQLNPATLFRFSPRSLFGLVFPLFRLITRGPLGLLEDWHPPVPADSRLAELPPSLDSGRYPPSPHHRFATTAKIPHEPQRSSPSTDL